MYLSRPAFLKRAPRSRASRILNQLASRPSANVRSSQSIQHVLQDILANMNNSSKTVESRMKELVELISKLPPWKAWTVQTDTVVDSAMQNLLDLRRRESKSVEDDADEKDSLPDHADDHSETISNMLADILIEWNGNVSVLTQADMDRFDEGDNFWFMFKQWLSCVSSPRDRHRHIQDETGAWITDEELRERLRHGDVLHFQNRTIEPVAWAPFSRALVPVSEKKDPAQDKQNAESETSPLLLEAP